MEESADNVEIAEKGVEEEHSDEGSSGKKKKKAKKLKREDIDALMRQNKKITHQKVLIDSKKNQIQKLRKLLEQEKDDKANLENKMYQMEMRMEADRERIIKLQKIANKVDDLEKENERFQGRIIRSKIDQKDLENILLKQKQRNLKIEAKIRGVKNTCEKTKKSHNQAQIRIKVLRKELFDQDLRFKNERETFEERIRKLSEKVRISKSNNVVKTNQNARMTNKQKKLIEQYQEEVIHLKTQLREASMIEHDRPMSPVNKKVYSFSPKKSPKRTIVVNSEMTKLSNKIKKLESMLEMKDREIEYIRHEKTEKSTNSRKSVIQQLTIQGMEKDRRIKMLEKRLAEKRSETKEMRREITQLENTLEKRGEKVLKYSDEISNLKKEMKGLNSTVTTLRAKYRVLKRFGTKKDSFFT